MRPRKLVMFIALAPSTLPSSLDSTYTSACTSFFMYPSNSVHTLLTWPYEKVLNQRFFECTGMTVDKEYNINLCAQPTSSSWYVCDIIIWLEWKKIILYFPGKISRKVKEVYQFLDYQPAICKLIWYKVNHCYLGYNQLINIICLSLSRLKI